MVPLQIPFLIPFRDPKRGNPNLENYPHRCFEPPRDHAARAPERLTSDARERLRLWGLGFGFRALGHGVVGECSIIIRKLNL